MAQFCLDKRVWVYQFTNLIVIPIKTCHFAGMPSWWLGVSGSEEHLPKVGSQGVIKGFPT
jgi:hypothetical protein